MFGRGKVYYSKKSMIHILCIIFNIYLCLTGKRFRRRRGKGCFSTHILLSISNDYLSYIYDTYSMYYI